jgi:transcriptional antiterminator
MKPKTTAVELAEIAGVTDRMVRRYAKELRELAQEEDDECE